MLSSWMPMELGQNQHGFGYVAMDLLLAVSLKARS